MHEKIQSFFHSPDLSEKSEQLKESLKETVDSVINTSRTYADSIFGDGSGDGLRSILGFFFSIFLFISLILLIQHIYHIWTCQQTRRPGKIVPIVKTDWRPDVVYLFQFPRAKSVPNTSPYCLKLETFLRHHKISYEVIETMTLRSVEGKLPFIELNGMHYADSELIICHLSKHFGTDVLEEVDEQQKGMVRAVSRMLDHGTFYPLLYFKLGKNITKFYDSTLAGHAPKFLKWLSLAFVYPKVWDMLNFEGTGRHSDAEVEAILRADLKALNAMLGDRLWLIGDGPTLADFTFFGHLAASYNLPYFMPVQRILVEEFPRLRALHDRMARTYFPELNFGRLSSQENQAKEGQAERTMLSKIME